MLLHFYTEPWLLQKEHMFIFLGSWIRYGQYLETGHVEFEEKKRPLGHQFSRHRLERKGHSLLTGVIIRNRPKQYMIRWKPFNWPYICCMAWSSFRKWVPFHWLVRSTPTTCIQLLIINDKLTSEKRGFASSKKVTTHPKSTPRGNPLANYERNPN